MIKPKDPNTKTSIFAVMSAMAKEYNAINLSQGFPEFEVSKKLISLVHKYMSDGYNQYAPMPGIPELRGQISKKVQKLYSKYYDPDTEITITAGGTQALHSAITTVVNEGDEVIIFEPAYDSYAPVVRMNGGRPVFIKLKQPDYDIDWEEVNKAVNSSTRLIIINTPHNPTGKIFTENDIKNLKKLVAGTKIMILSDEVYEHIIFDNNTHLSLASFPELAERSILVFSFGKMYHTTGWKMGFCLAPQKIMNEIRKIHQFTVFAVNTPIQYAVSEFLEFEDEYLKLNALFQTKRDYFNNLLTKIGYSIVPAGGTYFQTVSFQGLTEDSDFKLAEKLTKKFGLAAIPMSAFYHNEENTKSLRFCFAKSDEVLNKAAEKLADFYTLAKKQMKQP
jgi:methionine aminotransferase